MRLGKFFGRSILDRAALMSKQVLYGRSGEPITYGVHSLRYVPGTRPPRLEYIDSPDVTTSNDVRQLRFFLDHVSAGDFMVDVGSNVGQYAVLFASLVGGSGKVVAFEPGAQARAVLMENLRLNSFLERVRVEEVALFEATGTHSFFSRGSDAMASLERAGFGTEEGSADIVETAVPTMTFDDYLAERGLPDPEWVKLDTEGAEISILRGARRLLAGPARIVCELHPYAWESFGTSFDDLLVLMRESGRSIRFLDPRLVIADGPRYGATVIEPVTR